MERSAIALYLTLLALASTEANAGSPGVNCTGIHPDAFGNQTLVPGVCYLASDTTGVFLDARAFCQGLDSDLQWDVADIENETEQQFIHDGIAELKANGFLSAEGDNFWIGQNDMETEDVWRYLNESSNKCGQVVYDNWDSNQPNGKRLQNCIEYDCIHNNWEDRQCDASRKYLCKVKITPDTVPVCPNVSEDTSTEAPAGCAAILQGAFSDPSRPGVCYKGGITPVSFDAAQSYCQSLPGGSWFVADIEDAHENLFLDVWNRDNFPKNDGYWIGQNDRENEGDFRYSSSRKCPVYLNWESEQPNGLLNQNCMVMFKKSNGAFQDRSCSSQSYSTLCKLKTGSNQTGGAPPSCNNILSTETEECTSLRAGAFGRLDKPGVCYFMSGESKSWQGAVDFCQSEGWSLVDVEDAVENDILVYRYRNFAVYDRLYWVGQNDRETEGTWKYLSSDITPSYAGVFLNWESSQPNDQDGSQDCISTNVNGKLQDTSCSSSRYVTCKHVVKPVVDPCANNHTRSRLFGFVSSNATCSSPDALTPAYPAKTVMQCATKCLYREDCHGFGFVANGNEDACVLCGRVGLQRKDLVFKPGSKYYKEVE